MADEETDNKTVTSDHEASSAPEGATEPAAKKKAAVKKKSPAKKASPKKAATEKRTAASTSAASSSEAPTPSAQAGSAEPTEQPAGHTEAGSADKQPEQDPTRGFLLRVTTVSLFILLIFLYIRELAHDQKPIVATAVPEAVTAPATIESTPEAPDSGLAKEANDHTPVEAGRISAPLYEDRQAVPADQPGLPQLMEPSAPMPAHGYYGHPSHKHQPVQTPPRQQGDAPAEETAAKHPHGHPMAPAYPVMPYHPGYAVPLPAYPMQPYWGYGYYPAPYGYYPQWPMHPGYAAPYYGYPHYPAPQPDYPVPPGYHYWPDMN